MTGRVKAPLGDLLRQRDFLLLLIGQLISQVGDRMHEVVLGVAIWKMTGSPIAVGKWTMAIILPNLLFGPVAGALVDRWDKRKVMIFSDLARALIVALIPLALKGPVLGVYVLSFLATTASLFFRPARNAVIPAIFPKERFLAANSLALSIQNVTDFVGYPLAGVAAAALPLAVAFLLDSMSFFASAVCVYMMVVANLRDATAPKGRRLWGEIVEGLAFIGRTKVLLANFIVFSLALLICGGWNALIVILALEVVKTSSLGYGLFNGVHGLGMVLGGLTLGLLPRARRQGLMVAAGFIVTGLFIACPASWPSLTVGLISFFLTGIGNILFLAPSMSLMQELTPKEMIGRVSSVRASAAQVMLMVSTFALTALAETYGVRAVIIVDGLVLAALGLVCMLIPAVKDA
jgi:DHA3 family macrolide efflux protein-like MFS transporter